MAILHLQRRMCLSFIYDRERGPEAPAEHKLMRKEHFLLISVLLEIMLITEINY